MTQAEVTPTVDMSIGDAVQELTGFEAIGIEKRFGARLEDLGGIPLVIGLVWAYENRTAKRSWGSVEHMTVRDLTGYFAPDPEDVNPEEPDSEAGKGDSSDSEPTTT